MGVNQAGVLWPLLFAAALLFALSPACSPMVYYVDCDAPGPEHDGMSWDTAFLTVQEGARAAACGADVWVADGVYRENVVLYEGARLFGGFLGAEPGGYEESLDQRDYVNNRTVVDGGQSGSCIAMAPYSRIDGFVITNGSGTPTASNTYGGGVHCSNTGETAVIANNIICDNFADHGGGVYAYESSCAATENLVLRNSAAIFGGGLLSEHGQPTVTGNLFVDNWAGLDGGGVFYGYWLGVFEGNTVILNEAWRDGGGVYFILPIWGGGASGSGLEDGAGVSTPLDIQGVVRGNLVAGNTAGEDGGGFYLDQAMSVYLQDNVIACNESMATGGGISCFWPFCTPVVAGNSIVFNSSVYGGGVCCVAADPTLTNNNITGNSAGWGGGICLDTDVPVPVANNTVIENSADTRGGGVFCFSGATADFSHNDFWGNTPDDYFGCDPGPTDISEDPLFVDLESCDFHLTSGSPCIDAGDNSAPELPESDWDGEGRIANERVDIGLDEYLTYYTEAPDPQPECQGALFGEPASGYPGWVWFSIPLTPDCVVGSGCGDPTLFLGHGCAGRLWYFDKYLKSPQVYQPPFLTWDLAVGDGYLLYLEADVTNPSYEGVTPFTPWTFEFKLGRMGWTWIGMPGPTERTGDDFMSSVSVLYPSDETGVCRTAQADYDATPDNWISWGWPYWNTWAQAPETFTPYAPFGHRTSYPWVGYHVWVNVGAAASEDEPDQVTLVWPKP